MHDPQAEADRWLTAAREDLAYARHAVTGGFHAPACFHAQQAAEKAVKALHYSRGARAVLGHSVRALIEALEPGEALARLLDGARELDLFYIPARFGSDAEADNEGSRAAHRALGFEEVALIRCFRKDL